MFAICRVARYCDRVSSILTRPRLVRHADASTWDLRDRLSINPRNGYARGRAGLSWTGVREYETPSGMLRVLRRNSQVLSSGHKRTLRSLGTPEGHPSEDRDLTPATSELLTGVTDSQIDEEVVDGFARPVADFTVFAPATFSKMMSPEQWAEYQREHPTYAAGVVRPRGPARTGTSLGYDALWLSPTVEAELVSDRDGVIVAAWLGPDGNEYEYEAEHVIDPDCEIVQRLVREQSFDPSSLGGQHFAIALEALGGRGGQQSELLRVNDSQWIGADPTCGRVTMQVPRATRFVDVKWIVGASRDLPLEEGDRAWDGDEATASIFDGAGWPDSPDPSAAKLGFLVYDADAADKKDSYKLPIARRDEDGRLRVPKSGIDAASSFLRKTDAPSEVLDRAQSVLDAYNEKFERAQTGRDSLDTGDNIMTTTKQAIVIGVRDRAARNYLTKHGIAIPVDLTLTLDEGEAAKALPLAEKLNELIAALVEQLSAAGESTDEMSEKMAGMEEKLTDMPSLEEAQAQLKAAEEALEAVKAAAAESKKTSDVTLKTATDALALSNETNGKLNAELIPVRSAALDGLRTRLVGFGLDEAKAKDCADEGALKRAFVVARDGDDFAQTAQSTIDSMVTGMIAVVKAQAAKTPAAKYEPGKGLRALPNPSTQDSEVKPTGTTDENTVTDSISAQL